MAEIAAREGRELIDASRPFTTENRSLSWWHVVSTTVIVAAGVVALFLIPTWWVRLPLSIVTGLTIVRLFIVYHDVMHGAILKKSPLGRFLMAIFGVLVLTPSRIWRDSHNYHHAHTAKMVGSHIGSYPTLTVDIYRALPPKQQLFYRIARHPLTVLLAWVTVFLWGMCINSFRKHPRKYWESGVALVVHIVLIALIPLYADGATLFWAYLLPLNIAFVAGAYLFYAQHNFEDIQIQPRTEWSYTKAALYSSSMMRTGKIMEWFTGSIGFHHVHHLNPSIPFYRLEEAMNAIPELGHPGETSLHPMEIVRCFRLKLWDPEKGRMVGYPS